jgi:replication factor A1
MLSVEEIIERILSAGASTSREEVWRKIKEKKKAAGGFLTEETAARLVASELGVEVEQEQAHSAELPIGELVLGLNDVSIVGRVVVVFPLQSYARKNGSESQFGRLIVADKTGTLLVLLWNDKADLIRNGKVNRGQILRILHGYVREARDGQLELHLGNRSEFQINPSDVKEENYPAPESFVEKIGKVTKKKKKTSVLGVIESVSALRVFSRSDGSEGKVLRLSLRDSSGRIVVVLWNGKADSWKDVRISERLLLIDARVKEKIDGELELHVEDRAYVERLPPQVEEISKISSLVSEGGPVWVEGIVKTKPAKREVSTANGEKVLVTSFELEDESGRIWVSAWRKHADVVEQLTVGARVRLKNVYVRKGFGDAFELATRGSSQVEVSEE